MSNTIEATQIIPTLPCTVNNGEDWLSILSRRTGTELTLNVAEVPGAWDTLTAIPGATDLFDTLMDPHGGPRDIDVPIADMKLFKSIVERATQLANDNDALAANGITPPALTITSVQTEIEQDAISNEEQKEMTERERLMRSLQSKSRDKSPLFRIVYYIPTKVSSPKEQGGYNKFATLAARMRGYGLIPFDGSTYVGKQENVPHPIFAEMEKWNNLDFVKATQYLPKKQRLLVRWKCEEIHPRQLEATRNEAFEQLRDLVMEVQDSMLLSIDKAAKKIEELESKKEVTDKERSAANEQRIKNMSTTLSVAKKELGNAIKMAQAFDETESLTPLFQALRHALKSNHATLIALRKQQKDK